MEVKAIAHCDTTYQSIILDAQAEIIKAFQSKKYISHTHMIAPTRLETLAILTQDGYKLLRCASLYGALLEKGDTLICIEKLSRLEPTDVVVYVGSQTPEEGEKELEHIRSLLCASNKDESVINVILSIWSVVEGQLQESLHEVEFKVPTVIPEAYPYLDMEQLATFWGANESLLILSGPPGTGKSMLVKYLIGTNPVVKFPRICYVAGDSSFRDIPLAFNSFLRRDIVILEDVPPSFIKDNAISEHLASLLALSDGFLANTTIIPKIFIITNTNANQVNSTLLRDGRTFAMIECRKLTKEEAQKLYQALQGKGNIPVKHPSFEAKELFSIAEIYKCFNIPLRPRRKSLTHPQAVAESWLARGEHPFAATGGLKKRR